MPRRKIKQELLSAPSGPQSSPALTRVHSPQISSLRSQDFPQAAPSTTEPPCSSIPTPTSCVWEDPWVGPHSVLVHP